MKLTIDKYMSGTIFNDFSAEKDDSEARAMCDELESGTSTAQLMGEQLEKYPGVDPEDIGKFIGAAVGSHCQQYVSQFGKQ